MIYSFLKFLMRITVQVFFRSVHVNNRENIPAGPLLIVANHPSTFTDPILIATQLKQKIYFLAKGEVFRSAFAKWLLPKFNMIPVYRKQDDASLMTKNEETFEKCYEHLENKGSILLFPEGVSITERKLRKIKTGAARIALGAEAGNEFKLGVKILPIGLNYSNPHKFQSDVFINVDEAIDCRFFAEKYEKNKIDAANELTEVIRQRLEKLIIAIEDEATDKLVKNIEIVYKKKLQKDFDIDAKNMEDDFNLTKAILERVNYFREKDEERVEKISFEVNRYLDNLDRLNLNDHLLKNPGSGSVIRNGISSVIYFLLGFPFYLFGIVNNYLPYKMPYYIARKIAKTKEYIGPITMVSGTFTFLIFYSAQLYFVQKHWHETSVTLLYILALPLSGIFAYKYWRKFTNVRGKWLTLSLFMKRSVLISNLITQRELIISELERGREEYKKEILS